MTAETTSKHPDAADPAPAVPPVPPPDARRNAYRTDLAAKQLEGTVKAARYVDGQLATVARASAPVRGAPDVVERLTTEALYGEQVSIYEEQDGWAWVQLHRDSYVGYMPADMLARRPSRPTHRIQALGTFVYPVADIKAPPMMHLSMNALIGVHRLDERFAELEHGGYVVTRHIAPVDRFARDYADVAERFIGTPYLWGGRSRIGIDCSGLVQTAFHATGRAAPRDSDMQQAELGEPIAVPRDFDGLQRGDLIFWAGHVGIMVDGVMMIHANAHHMMVHIEPLPEAAARIAKGGSHIVAVKRVLPGAA